MGKYIESDVCGYSVVRNDTRKMKLSPSLRLSRCLPALAMTIDEIKKK